MRKLQLARGIIINRKIAKGYENLVFAQAEKSMTGGAAIAAWAAGRSLASGAAHTPSVVGKERKSSDMPFQMDQHHTGESEYRHRRNLPRFRFREVWVPLLGRGAVPL
jgi:hypothetical protein